MPSIDEVVLDIERNLMPIMEAQILELKSMTNWVDRLRFIKTVKAARALKWVNTKLIPAYHEYKKVYCLNTPEKWVNLQCIDPSFAEVIALKKRVRKIKEIWLDRPRYEIIRKKKD